MPRRRRRTRRHLLAAAGVMCAILLSASGGAAKAPDTSGQAAPTNITPPSITGTAAVGQTLTADPGSWAGKAVKYSYQWLRCDSTGASCAPVAGSTGRTYALVAADLASTLRVQVVAASRGGSTVAVSAASGSVVDDTAPTAPGPVTISASDAGSVSLSWSASTDDVGVTGYDVYQGGKVVTTTAATNATVPGLSCNSTYTLAVAAYDAAGNTSSATSVSAATAACPTTISSPSQPKSIYWGAYIEGATTYNYLYGGTWSNAPWCDPGTNCALPKFESNAGKQASIEHWGMCWTCSFDSGVANLVVSRGDLPAVDWSNGNALDADVASGKYDSYITGIAQAIKSFGHPLFVLFDEEMNGTWYSYSPGQNGNTASDFVAMWRHVHDVFNQVGATNVTWVWAPNVDPSGVYTDLGSVYPGDSYVDWTALNGYNWGGGNGGGWMSFSSVFGTSYKALLQLAPTKPIMIGEVASEEYGGSKSAWITDALATQLPTNFPAVKALLWFNWRVNEKGQYWNWEIESSLASQQAFAQGIASPYYAAGGTFGSLPLLTKIKPL